MTNITINERRRELVITKKFEKAASRFGSPEYLELREAKNDNIGFKVVVRTNGKNKKETFKGLDYAYMEKYIIAHDDEEETIMKEFEMMRATSEEAKALLVEPASYFEVKEWFLATFPEIAEFHKKREAIMERIQKAREERTAA